tara:strand:- start:374 stop:562 length:189 start_codon:yes stop_codon:yes gene_type:complete
MLNMVNGSVQSELSRFFQVLHNKHITAHSVTTAAFCKAVPVPAAAWLFGSALIGLVGVKRKK